MSLSSPTTSSLSQPSAPIESKITRGHSCLLCRRRKIKCDGQHPCQNCFKTRAECVVPEVAPARRRKRKAEDLIARLRKCEEIIAKNGLKFEDEDDIVDIREAPEGVSVERGRERQSHYVEVARNKRESKDEGGKLIVQGGQSRYIENSIWENVFVEVREDSTHAQLQESSASEDETSDQVSLVSDYSSLIFGRLMVTNSLTSSHPSPVHIFRLWQTFIDNVHPLTHLLHAPTTQSLILQASGDLDKIPANLEALMFAIYHIAIVSLDEQECQSMLGESRTILQAKYSNATQQALCNAKVLKTSDIMVLQALSLYLLSIRSVENVDIIWCLAGIASRIGERIGLHREFPAANLTILEREIRRRLWWQILTLEGHSSSISGFSGQSFTVAGYSAHINILLTRPGSSLSNVNDSDLSPSMRELPHEHPGATEMMFCCVRYEIVKSLWGGTLLGPEADKDPIPSRIKAIDDIEAMLDEKYLRYADPSIPLHFLSTIVVRNACAQMRLRVYASQKHNNSIPQPQAERDAAFSTALQMIEYDNQCHIATKTMIKGFSWQVRVCFMFEAFVFVLTELLTQTTGEKADWAWRQVEASYGNHPEILIDTKNKLKFTVGNLCLRGWEERVKARKVVNGGMQMQLERPEFVKELYAQRGVKVMGGSSSAGQSMGTGLGMMRNFQSHDPLGLDGDSMNSASGGWIGGTPSDAMLSMPYDPYDVLTPGSMDWEYWQTLFDDCGAPLYT